MVFEVFINVLSELITCRFLLLNKFFTFELFLDITNVLIKLIYNLPHIVCCIKYSKKEYFKGQF